MYHVSPWRLLTLSDLDEARRNFERVAFVGVTDRFEESIRLLCLMCDWPLPDAVPHENRTTVRPGTKAVSPEARAALEELTALDAELYRLGADLFADALRDVPFPHLPPAPSRIDLTFEGPIPGSDGDRTGTHGALLLARASAGPLPWSPPVVVGRKSIRTMATAVTSE
jgi:hypothetical protein